jgi:hypothetical protein
MNIDLETIQEMWEKDSKMDIDNLHTESLNIPILHAKYFDLYNTTNLLKKKAEQQRKKIRHEKYEYFTGKADPQVYQENPFPKKIRDKETLQGYLESDEKVSQVTLKVEYYEVISTYLESILKQISERNWQIRNSIEFMKFTSGLG